MHMSIQACEWLAPNHSRAKHSLVEASSSNATKPVLYTNSRYIHSEFFFVRKGRGRELICLFLGLRLCRCGETNRFDATFKLTSMWIHIAQHSPKSSLILIGTQHCYSDIMLCPGD